LFDNFRALLFNGETNQFKALELVGGGFYILFMAVTSIVAGLIEASLSANPGIWK
jgi:hypothetical protein